MDRVLLTGATGFVGSRLRVALEAAGYDVRLCARDPDRARARRPGGDWTFLDIERPESFLPALEGCEAAFYLIHRVGASSDYPEREKDAARAFAEAAARRNLRRIVYLGGVAPKGLPSRHLESRLETGSIFRSGDVPAVELRAAMIVGHGSTSWRMVRELAGRLPAMVLPRWLTRHSWPVSLDDVVLALLAALEAPDSGPGCYEIPGPERISHRQMLARAAKHLGRRPWMIGVPVLTPRLSSYWIGWVTSVELAVARELVHGLVSDLDPAGPSFWELGLPGVRRPIPLDRAIELALADEGESESPSPSTRARLERIGRDFTAGAGDTRRPPV
jgi:uncharacterized protein YbjT (DUF2867 family)